MSIQNLQALAVVNGNVTVQDGIVTLPDGSSFNLIAVVKSMQSVADACALLLDDAVNLASGDSYSVEDELHPLHKSVMQAKDALQASKLVHAVGEPQGIVAGMVVIEVNGSIINCFSSTVPLKVIILDDDTEGDQSNVIPFSNGKCYVSVFDINSEKVSDYPTNIDTEIKKYRAEHPED